MKSSDYLQRILKSRVYDVVSESPLELAPALSKRIGNRLLLKREDLHPVFSFKLRGAYNKMALLPRKKLKKGSFALPGKRKYPIPDKAHARNALARVAQHGTPAEQKKVKAAVKKRYPGIGKKSKGS